MATLDTIIGVSLALVGGIVQSAGFIAQKYGHNKVNEENEDIPKEEQKSVLTKGIWWLGIIVYTAGGTCNAIALNYAAQSIISPMSALNLATVAIFSYFILKEPLSVKDIIAMVIIAMGIVVVVYFGPSGDNNAAITIDQLRIYFQGTAYIITIIALSVFTVFVYIGVKYAERKNFNSQKNEEITYGRNYLLFSYTYISTFFASNNTLFIKSGITIIISSLISVDNLKTNTSDYLSYVVIALYFVCVISMEYWRQKALSHFGALLVIPIFNVVSIIMTSVIGMIYFEEYSGFTMTTAVLFSIGIVVTICGVLVLSLDISKIWSDLYDEMVKVALVNYDTNDYKYPKTAVCGGPISEFYQNRFLKKPGVFYNADYGDLITNQEMEDMEHLVADGNK